MRFGFCGPMYQSQSPLMANEQLINWYPETPETPNARSALALYPDPGLGLFANLGAALPSVRGGKMAGGRRFFVAGTHLCELTGAGVITDYGAFGGNNNIVDDGLPVTMAVGGTVGGNYPTQLLICSGGTLTVFSLASNTFQALTTPPANNLMVDFSRGFFLSLQSGNTWSVSSAEDATTWPGLSVGQVSVFSDQLLALIESNDLVWVLGATHGAAYYNSGAPIFPFDVLSGGVFSTGILAQFSICRIATKSGTAIAWLGGDERGGPMVYVNNGLIPQRVSDHGLELFMNKQTVADAVGMARQSQGHNFYDLWFPTANVTWTLDTDNGWWHQRSSLVNGQQAAHLGRCHIYDGAQHLVGDRTSGNVYLMSENLYSENVSPGVFHNIIRTRVGPSISSEGAQQLVPINEFQLDVQTGLGPEPPLKDAFGLPRDPQVMVSYSEDFGRTFGPERMLSCGQAGNFAIPVIDRRLGSWRSWTPKVVASDAVPWRIVDAYTNSTQNSQERLAKRFAGMG